MGVAAVLAVAGMGGGDVRENEQRGQPAREREPGIAAGSLHGVTMDGIPHSGQTSNGMSGEIT
jgi:hypothetical protein